jgi:hypothetical protein
MKLKLIKWVIGWLLENHYYLVLEMAIPEGKHIHSNPRKKVAAKSDRTAAITMVRYDSLIARDEAE